MDTSMTFIDDGFTTSSQENRDCLGFGEFFNDSHIGFSGSKMNFFDFS